MNFIEDASRHHHEMMMRDLKKKQMEWANERQKRIDDLLKPSPKTININDNKIDLPKLILPDDKL